MGSENRRVHVCVPKGRYAYCKYVAATLTKRAVDTGRHDPLCYQPRIFKTVNTAFLFTPLPTKMVPHIGLDPRRGGRHLRHSLRSRQYFRLQTDSRDVGSQTSARGYMSGPTYQVHGAFCLEYHN